MNDVTVKDLIEVLERYNQTDIVCRDTQNANIVWNMGDVLAKLNIEPERKLITKASEMAGRTVDKAYFTDDDELAIIFKDHAACIVAPILNGPDNMVVYLTPVLTAGDKGKIK